MGMVRAGRYLLRQFIKRNTEYLKRTSSGRDLVIYCHYTQFVWHPNAKGFAGSEEAIINLARELVKLGWDVTVYNNCGHKPLLDAGVTYRPFWEFNPRDKQDVVILWRWPKPVDWNLNAEKIFIDMHDVTSEGMFTHRGRIEKAAKIVLRSQLHRSLFPNLTDDKIAIIPNGIDLTLLEGTDQKDPYLLINTSSAERSMNALPKLFREVKRRVPRARLQWAYGWELFELFDAKNPEKLQWMRQTQRDMGDAGIESLGHLGHAEVGKLYQRGAIFAYPTVFPETDCISAKKAQAAGCVPVTTDAAALADSVRFGVKVPCGDPNLWKKRTEPPYGIEAQAMQQSWIEAVVDLLNNPAKRAELGAQGAEWGRQFAWPQIAARWDEILRA